jgi:hypothetical protein
MKANYVVTGCVGALLLCAGFCGLGTFLFQKRATDGFFAEIAQAKSDGLPTTMAEFTKPVEPKLNAGPGLLAAAEALKKETSERTRPKSGRTTPTFDFNRRDWESEIPKNEKFYNAAIASMNPALDRAVAATKMPAFGFDRDYNKGFSTLFPEYAEMKMVSRWLSTRAILRAKAGNELGMAEDLRAIARISAFCATDDILLGYLVQVSVEEIGMKAALQCLSLRNGSPGSIRAVRDAARALGPIPNVKNSIRAEYFLTMLSLKEIINKRDPNELKEMLGLGADSSPASEYGIGKNLMMVPGMLDTNAKNALEQQRLNYLALPTDPLDLVKSKSAFNAATRRLIAQEKNPQYYLANMLSPVFEGAADAFVTAAQERRLMEILLVGLEERNRSGRFPPKLPVKGALATDLFDGGVLRYSLKAGRLRIYSVGPDGNDNGGVGPSTSPGGGEHDIVVSFPSE